MVLTFFRNGDGGMAEVTQTVTAMLADARHSFDLAMSTVVGGAEPVSVTEEVFATDHQINEAEQEIRRRLLVHASVHGAEDIDMVLGYLLLSRKVERIGDQAKNILDLATEGVNLGQDADIDELRASRDEISNLFTEVAAVFGGPDASRDEEIRQNGLDLAHEMEARLRMLIHTDEPASYAVPRALLYRYLKRIAANLAGIVSSAIDPLDQVDYPGGLDSDD